MKFKNPKTIMALGFSITAIASTAVAVPLALTYFSYSYNSQLDARQLSSTPIEVVSGAKFTQKQFDEVVEDLKIKPKYAQMQVDNALKLDRSGLYSFSLVNAYDFSAIENAGFNVEIDSSDATIKGNIIKNVIVKADKVNGITYTKNVDLKGFAAPVTLPAGTSKTLDFEPEKSSITFSGTRFVLPSEFAFMLEDKFQRNFSDSRDLNQAFVNALKEVNAKLDIRNDLNLPSILTQGESLLPQVTINDEAAKAQMAIGQQKSDAPVYNLNFSNSSDQDGTLAINLEIFDSKTQQVKAKFSLEIENLASQKQINDAIQELVSKNINQYFSINTDIQYALNKDNLTLVQMLSENQFSPSVVAARQAPGWYKWYVRNQEKQAAAAAEKAKKDAEAAAEKAKQQTAAAAKAPAPQPTPAQLPAEEEVVFRAKSKDDVAAIATTPAPIKVVKPIDPLEDINTYFTVKPGVIPNTDPRLENYSFEISNTALDLTKDTTGSNDSKVNFTLSVTKKLNVQSPYLQNLASGSQNPKNTSVISNNYQGLTTKTIPTQGTAPYSYQITYNVPVSVELPLYEIKSASTLTKQIPVSESHSLFLASDAFAMAKDLTELANKNEYSLDELGRIVSAVYLFGKGYLIQGDQKTVLVSEIAKQNTTISKADVQFAFEDLGTRIWNLISQTNENLTAKVEMVTKDKIAFSLVNSNNIAIETIQVDGFGVKSPAFVAANKYRADLFLDARYGGIVDDQKGGQFIRDYTRGDLKFNLNGNTSSVQGISLNKALTFENNKTTPAAATTTQIKNGALFLAVDLKNIQDGKKYYLLTNSQGKGLFVQKITKETQTPPSTTQAPDFKISYILGMDIETQPSGNGQQNTALALLLSGDASKLVKDNNGVSYDENETDKTISKNVVNNPKTNSDQFDKYNIFLQYQQKNQFDQYAPIQSNSTLVLQIVKSGTSFDIVAQTSASSNPSHSDIGSLVFSIKDNGNTLNWDKIGADVALWKKDSKNKVVFKGLAIFENNAKLASDENQIPSNDEIRQAFVDTYILNK